MASFTITLVAGSACSGGEHATARIEATTPNITKDVAITRSGINSPPTSDEIAAAVEALLRFIKADDGLTQNQLAQKFSAGITVTLT